MAFRILSFLDDFGNFFLISCACYSCMLVMLYVCTLRRHLTSWSCIFSLKIILNKIWNICLDKLSLGKRLVASPDWWISIQNFGIIFQWLLIRTNLERFLFFVSLLILSLSNLSFCIFSLKIFSLEILSYDILNLLLINLGV